MGARKQFLAILTLCILRGSFASDLPPIGFIPIELQAYFHPDEVNDPEHDGIVERHRRASGVDNTPREEEETRPIYIVSTHEGAPCILVMTDAIFRVDYRTLRHGIKTVKLVLPDEPMVTGTCVNQGITAIITLHWGGFKFSLVFEENPEGNSYYLDYAKFEFNQTIDIFPETTYRGHVTLTTRSTSNYYFTPLGKSYVCEKGEDQGPLTLFNEDDEPSGNLTLFNTKFQPFVKRAKGDWGPEQHCLPKATQVMRENVVPYFSSLIFSFAVAIMISVYGIKRYFTSKKTSYTFYGDGTDPNVGDETEAHEMKAVQNGSKHDPEFDYEFGPSGTNGSVSAAQQLPAKPAQPANNPFRKDTTSNPFNQSSV